jgi:predicted DNA-binding protein
MANKGFDKVKLGRDLHIRVPLPIQERLARLALDARRTLTMYVRLLLEDHVAAMTKKGGKP